MGGERPVWQGARTAHTDQYERDEQRRQTGWLDAKTWEVIFSRALTKGRGEVLLPFVLILLEIQTSSQQSVFFIVQGWKLLGVPSINSSAVKYLSFSDTARLDEFFDYTRTSEWQGIRGMVGLAPVSWTGS